MSIILVITLITYGYKQKKPTSMALTIKMKIRLDKDFRKQFINKNIHVFVDFVFSVSFLGCLVLISMLV